MANPEAPNQSLQWWQQWLDGLAARHAAFPVGENKRAIPPYWALKGGQHLTAENGCVLEEHIAAGGHIAIIPGRLNCLVIDIDVPKGADNPEVEEAVAFVIAQLGLPLLRYDTPSGGVHLWYRTENPQWRSRNLYMGDKHFGELRCDAGYVVAWDIQRVAGGLEYWPNATPVTDAKRQALLPKRPALASDGKETTETPATAPEGQRNDSFNKRLYADFGASKTPAEAAYAAINNIRDALANPKPLPVAEILATAHSAAKGAFGDAEGTVPVARVTVGSEYVPEAWQFLWDGWLPIGALTLLGGDGGTGKGTLMARLAAAVAGKQRWPDGSYSNAGRVALVGSEDHYQRTVRPRYDAAGCPPEMWEHHALPSGVTPYESFMAQPLADDVRMVVVDPLIQGMTADANSTTKARTWAEGWAKVAEERNVAVVGIMHNVKWSIDKSKTGSLADLIAGSGQWKNTARAAWILVKHPDEPTGPRLLHLAKTNYDEPAACLTYRVTGELTRSKVNSQVMRVTHFEEDETGAIEVRKTVEGRTDKAWLQEGDDALARLEPLGMFDKAGQPLPTIDDFKVICKSSDWHGELPDGWNTAKRNRYRTKRSIEVRKEGTVWFMGRPTD